MTLADRSCVPCTGKVPPLDKAAASKLKAELDQAWELVEAHHLRRVVRFPDFKQALDYVNRVGAVAEAENHHPDLQLGWGKVVVEVHTHAIDGLTESDFVLAAKLDRLAPSA